MNPVNHVAIIMDGNGRWGLKHKKSRNAGHRAGLKTVEAIIKETLKSKIKSPGMFKKHYSPGIPVLINQTKYTQIAIFTASISIFNYFKKEVNYDQKNINFMLGHSLGEYTALAAANILSIEDCSKLLKIRGELMQNATNQMNQEWLQ